MNSVIIKNLTQKFEDIVALNDLSVEFGQGIITGVIGPDGAGKTTLLRNIIGLLVPQSGEITTLELNPITQKQLLNAKIGYMPQKFGLYEDLTVIQNLELYADLKEIGSKTISSASLRGAPATKQSREETFDKLLTMTDLKEFTARLAGKLSGGMKQKLGLACSLLGEPELLVLDEPSVGVDPISRRELMKMVKDFAAAGTTIIWSTAYLDEAYNFDKILILNNGKSIYKGEPQGVTRNPAEFEDKVIELMGGYNRASSKIADKIQLPDISGEYTVEAIDLVKKYGDFYAVKKNSFNIKKGEIFGLLGPNGAGKSTSFKMMCGLSAPTSGVAKVMGVNIQEHPTHARSYLGYMAQKFSLYSSLSVLENLDFYSGIYGLRGDEQKERIDEMSELFEFKKYLHTNAGELPLGYKQRLAMACAIMHNPPILFLDEPTSGVDPLWRREFWGHIRALADKGVTVLVTTHFMDEAEFCDRLSLFYQGESIALGTPNELKQSVNAKTMEEAFVALIEKYDDEKT